MKKRFYSEAAYVLGIVLLAFGTALMERAELGMSMVVAPAYILHLKLSQTFAFFTFGMAEYVLQGALLAVMMLLVMEFRKEYLLSFATAVFYGFTLDIMLKISGLLGNSTMGARITLYALGMVVCAAGISLLFHTYIPLEAYEMFVKETSRRTGMDINKFKTVYDCISCAAAVVMSLAFFGRLEGVKLGTVICALINGRLIGISSELMERAFVFEDGLKLRKYIEREAQHCDEVGK